MPTRVSLNLEQAVRRFQSPLIHYVEQMLPNRPDQAQDVVQTTFLRFRKALLNGTSIRHTTSWLYRVAHNLAIDLNRREDRQCGLEESTPSGDRAALAAATSNPGPDECFRNKEARELALEELRQLSPEVKQILLLKLFAEMTLQQISDATGVSIGTVHYRLGRGLRELQQRFKALGAI